MRRSTDSPPPERTPTRSRLALSSFSYLNSGMTQAQDLAAVLANVTTSASGTTIHDSKGDNLTLTGFTASMIIAAASHFHFA